MTYTLTALLYAAFLVLGAFMVRGRQRPMQRTMFTVIANYVLAFAYTWTTQDPDPWAVFMGLDFVSACVILIRPAGIGQGVVGLLYLMQIITHAVYAFKLPEVDGFVYWWLLTGLAFAQLAAIGGWMLHDRGLRLRRFLGRNAVPLAAHRASLEG